MRTPFTYNLVWKNSPKEIFYHIFVAGSSHLVFEAIEKNTRKLIDIHLLMDVGWLSLIVLEGMTEFSGSIILLFALIKIVEHFFYLEKHVLILNLFSFEWIFALNDSLSEFWYHVNLLEKAIHIASASKILESYIATCWFKLIADSESPVFLFSGSPEGIFMKIW